MEWRFYQVGLSPETARPYYAPNQYWAFWLAWRDFGPSDKGMTCYGSSK